MNRVSPGREVTMLRCRMSTAALSAGVLIGVVALAGCSDSEDVPTLDQSGGTGGQAEVIAAQARSAEDLVDCLAAAEILAATEASRGDGQLRVVLQIDQEHIMSWGGWPEASETAADSVLDVAAQYDPRMAALKVINAGGSPPPMEDIEVDPYLVIGATDRTGEFRQCLKSSGYTEPVAYPDPNPEIAEKQLMLDATLPWIDCARANGYVDIKDPLPVKADGWQTQPLAVLPADMEEDAFRSLIEVCPIIDEAAWTANYKARQALPPNPTREEFNQVDVDYPRGEPSIGFDLPGLDGHPNAASGAPYPDNVSEIFLIIQLEEQRFDEEHPDLVAW
ncbi:MAG: hypothetical protein LBC97_06815 [Bifidobacteriaceae bacterium]|nr:hypothetical protein [Bifidobacteriaceae bacterium]